MSVRISSDAEAAPSEVGTDSGTVLVVAMSLSLSASARAGASVDVPSIFLLKKKVISRLDQSRYKG